jgi:hypothetical protein
MSDVNGVLSSCQELTHIWLQNYDLTMRNPVCSCDEYDWVKFFALSSSLQSIDSQRRKLARFDTTLDEAENDLNIGKKIKK